MTLDTDLIEKESLALYSRYLKDPRIPEEACSDIYLEVVKRLKRERQRGTKRISGGHLGQVLKLATKTVFHNRKNEKEHEGVLTNIIERNASLIWCTRKNSEEREFFDRIARFLKEWAGRKGNYPGYLHIFVLYHAFHLSPEFIDALAPSTGRGREELDGELETLREEIRSRANEQLRKKITTRNIRYYNLIKKEAQMGGLSIKQYDCSQKDFREAKEKEKQILKAIETLSFFPSWTRIEELTGQSRKSVSYAYQTVTKAIRESFKDDTFWGQG